MFDCPFGDRRLLPEIVAAAAGAFRNVDNLTVLNGAQGMSEIMNQVIGQAGPALALAKQALAATATAPPRPRRRPPPPR
jgi:flotillin